MTATATSGRLQSWLGASAAADALRVSTRPHPTTAREAGALTTPVIHEENRGQGVCLKWPQLESTGAQPVPPLGAPSSSACGQRGRGLLRPSGSILRLP